MVTIEAFFGICDDMTIPFAWLRRSAVRAEGNRAQGRGAFEISIRFRVDVRWLLQPAPAAAHQRACNGAPAPGPSRRLWSA